jgi:hypothetical protein
MAYTREGKWIGPCGCEACEKRADCDYCGTCSPEDGPENVNLMTVTEGDGGWNASVAFANGFTESIEGLYDRDDALAYVNMHLRFQTNKYVRK